MNPSLLKSFGCSLVAAYLGLTVSGCNTTKATGDTLVKFFSSTSPGELFTRDGLVARDQKISLYTTIVCENVQQDIASGDGEYLASLGVLMDIPRERQQEWVLFTQSQYSVLFSSDRRNAKEALAGLSREFAAAPNTRGVSRP